MKSSYLLGEHIFLRAVEPEDLGIMFEMENDPSMWDISSFTVPYSHYVLRQYISNTQYDIFSDKQLRLMIIRQVDNEILGTIDISDFVPLHSHGAIGIAIHHNYRRNGYAAEALKLLCEYAFEFLNIKQLYAYVASDNKPSLNLFTSCGFKESGVLADWLLVNGVYKSVVVFQNINLLRR